MIATLRHRRVWLALGAITASVWLGACASSGALRLGDDAVRTGDWDAAVEHFRRALQEDPNDAVAQISLERAMQNAARAHETLARELEAEGELPGALAEYRQASKFDPTNGKLMATVSALQRRIRDAIEAAQPPSRIEQLQAQTAPILPLLDPSFG